MILWKKETNLKGTGTRALHLLQLDHIIVVELLIIYEIISLTWLHQSPKVSFCSTLETVVIAP